MSTLLLEKINTVATFDENRTRLKNAWILIRDQQIDSIGTGTPPVEKVDQRINLSGHVVLPGMVNTHHHLFQALLRNIPALQDVALFDWLHTMYLLMSEVTDEAQYVSALVNQAELLLSGCTTNVDHSYLRLNDMEHDTEIRAAREIGIRFHLARGSFSIGQSQGGLPPDHIVEDEDDILADTERLIRTYHDPDPFAMTRIDNAPCSPFSITPRLMRESIKLARTYDVGNHTHLAESPDDDRYMRETYGRSSVEVAEDWGWVGPDVWYAHGVVLSDSDIDIMARTGTAVAHCPNSNMYTAAGCCRVRDLLRAGVTVGLAVDGSAANNASNMINEVRNALLLQRAFYGADSLSPTQALELATIGGAKLLRRKDIGAIETGKAADLIAVNINQLAMAGGMHDPVAGVVLCSPGKVDYTIVNGRVLVARGELVGMDIAAIIERHNALSGALVKRTEKRYGLDLSGYAPRQAYPYEERG
ncbi:MAG: 8-oxoguanine deaminase [Anaerolineales bacterium]|nr:8-oxoguanine deaminase [Anaerolineales bacterium]